MSNPEIDATELARILKQAGLALAAEEVRAILPGAAIVAAMIERVRRPLPREAEPAVIFEAEPGR
ncbi:MAG: hypothetical protein EXQ87_01035 [Alphaproteobacteria bacterium]|nr:hypothetical protein [Alphaproteobacteria bacterium]